MKFIIGTKEEMTQFFSEDGRAFAGTVLKVRPIVVSQVKGKEKDGYTAVQVGFGEQKPERLSNAVKGHLKDLPQARTLKEFRLSDEEVAKFSRGASIDVSIFKAGDIVEVSAVSKGKGFQGVVKRHGFRGGPRTHGQKHSEREPGAIGGGGRAGGRVAKGIRMAGRMGGDRVTVKNLKVLAVKPEEQAILIGGAIPGRKGTLVEIRGN